jgi:putative SOS response-associated peptidase YedK
VNYGTEDIPMQWGLVPSFFKPADPTAPKFEYFRMFNARLETVGSKGMFKRLVNRKRCLVLVDAFYEWKKDQFNEKQPFNVHRKDGKPLYFAGLFDTWRGHVPDHAKHNPGKPAEDSPQAEDAPEEVGGADSGPEDTETAESSDSTGELLYSVTMLTTSPSDEMKWLHDRMPLMFASEEDAEAWLHTDKYTFEDLVSKTAPMVSSVPTCCPNSLAQAKGVPLQKHPLFGHHMESALEWHPCSKKMNNLHYQEPDAGAPAELPTSPSKPKAGKKAAPAPATGASAITSFFKKEAQTPASTGGEAAGETPGAEPVSGSKRARVPSARMKLAMETVDIDDDSDADDYPAKRRGKRGGKRE